MRLFLLASLSILAPAVALAQPAAPPKEPPPQVDPVTTIVRIDTNHDGAASREEWVSYGNHDSGFTNIDVDKDGRLTVAELTVFRNARALAAGKPPERNETEKVDAKTTVLMADTNQDGAVTEAEWIAYGNHGGAGFTPVDSDHDGKITAAELTAFRASRPPAATASR